jgi:hypothetical protein
MKVFGRKTQSKEATRKTKVQMGDEIRMDLRETGRGDGLDSTSSE